MKSPCSDIVRARPLLGTFVEIRVRGLALTDAHAAINRAFGVIARVQGMMSPHDPASDVSRLHRAADEGKSIRIDPWTGFVLGEALRLSAASGGVFDVTAIPGRSQRGERPVAGDWRDVELGPGNRVSCRRPLRIDLGGIAKGFAVDCALDVLRDAGAGAGVVNAGGDLRVCGPEPVTIHLRHPADPGRFVPAVELRDEAMATSGNYLDVRGAGRLVKPDGGRLWLGRDSVSVRAPSCLFADALAKIVAAVGPQQARPLLRAHDATALVLGRQKRHPIGGTADAA